MNRHQRRSGVIVAGKLSATKLIIGIPSSGTAPTDFGLGLALMMYHMAANQHIHPIMVHKMVNPLDRARNEIVAHAYEYEADYIFFLDSDMVVPKETIAKLMFFDRDIVGCNYPRRDNDLRSTSMGMDGKLLSEQSKGLIEVKGIPTGCLLIKMDVFKKLAFPFFKFDLDEKTGITLSEDYYFCNKARQAGYKIFCDTQLSRQIRHIGQQNFQFS